ncbi:MAG: gliding motility-associated ABC transporter permease subunit GldF [Fulvivirga sp.]|nr:gliding motility-associated ABC transporter permease subunit GldF [Fulvivirga sp.]
MYQVFLKEFKTFFNSLIAYMVICVFLTSMGLLLWVFPETSILNYGYADMETLFALGPFVFMFLIPAVTMRMFAEEKRGGTLELLMTKPLTDWQIILGKYLSAVMIMLMALLPTLIYYYTVYQLGDPVGNIDTAGVIGSYVGLIMLGAVFSAIGILASSLSNNQIVSFILAVFLSFMLYTGLESLAAIDTWGKWSLFFEQLGLAYHYRAMSNGMLDTRNLIYLISVSSIMLFITKLIIGSRRW